MLSIAVYYSRSKLHKLDSYALTMYFVPALRMTERQAASREPGYDGRGLSSARAGLESAASSSPCPATLR